MFTGLKGRRVWELRVSVQKNIIFNVLSNLDYGKKKSTDCGDEEVLLYLVEISSSSKVKLHILLDQNFVLLCR